MPMKGVVIKNPYCKRSKLTKKQFENLVYYYFAEIIDQIPRDKIRYLFMMTDWSREEERTQRPFTRQAIGSNFDKISQYIWDTKIVNSNPLFQEEDVFDDLLDLIYEKKEEDDVSSKYLELYIGLGNLSYNPNKDIFISSLMFHLLSSRSKAIKGFNDKKFYLEFSRIVFICLTIDALKIKLPSIYAAHPLEYPFEKIRNFTWNKEYGRRPEGSAEFQNIDAEYQKTNTERRKIIGYAKGLLLSFLDENPM